MSTADLSTDILDRAKAAGCPIAHKNLAATQSVGYYHNLGRELRDGGPIWVNDVAQGYWMVTSFDLVREVYQTTDLFSSESLTPDRPQQDFTLIPTNIDPPEHKLYRGVMAPWFTPKAVQGFEDQMRSQAVELISSFADTGGREIVTEFCMQFPTLVFLSIVGLPEEEMPKFVGWVEAFLRGFTGEEALSRGDGQQPGMEAAIANILEHIQVTIEDRRDNPRYPDGDLPDFFTHLSEAEIDGRKLTDDELQNMGLLLVIGGLDTTRAHLGWMLWHLATHPEDRKRIVDEPELIPLAVEESLRYHAMVFGNARKVTRDIEWHGVQLRKGDMILASNLAANRDPNKFPSPDTFQLDRKVPYQVGFADGPHRCIGQHVARAEIRVAIEEWHKLIPEYELAPGAVLHERGMQLSLDNLPLVWPSRS